MQASTVTAYSLDLDNRFWRKALWLTAVTLTLGMCLLTPKRVLAEELRNELLARQSEAELFHGELPQSITRKLV